MVAVKEELGHCWALQVVPSTVCVSGRTLGWPIAGLSEDPSEKTPGCFDWEAWSLLGWDLRVHADLRACVTVCRCVCARACAHTHICIGLVCL